MKKWCIRLGLAQGFIVLVLLAVVIHWLNPLTKKTLLYAASSTLSADVEMGDVWVYPLRGIVKVKDVRIANVPGYDGETLFSAGEIRLNMSMRSLFSEHVSIKQIEINKPVLNVYVKGRQSNLRDFINRLPTSEEPAERAPGGKRVVVEEVEVSDPRLQLFSDREGPPFTLAAEAFKYARGLIVLSSFRLENPSTFLQPHGVFIQQVEAYVKRDADGIPTLFELRVLSPEVIREMGAEEDNLTRFKSLILSLASHDSAGGLEASENGVNLFPRKLIVSDARFCTAQSLANKTGDVRAELLFAKLAILPLDGVGKVSGLKLANPKSFSHDYLMELGELQIGVDLHSLNEDVIVISEVMLLEPTFVYEKRLRTNNLEVFQKHLLKLMAVEAAGPSAADQTQRIVVQHLMVKDGKVLAKFSKLPTAPIRLPDLERFNVGSGEGDVGMYQLTKEVSGILYETILGAVL